MKSEHRKRKGILAAELMKQLEQDPEYLARVAEKESQREIAVKAHRKAALPLLEELQEAGFAVESLDELRRSGRVYQGAIPILLRWLPRVTNNGVKVSIVRTLSVPWAKLLTAKPLIAEFRSAPNDASSELKWAIGNALEVVTDDTVFDDITELVRDKRHGTAREMLAVALGKMKDPRAVDVLIELLDDEEVAGHALIALGKLKAQKARSRIEKFLNHPKPWVRKEAAKALARLNK